MATEELQPFTWLEDDNTSLLIRVAGWFLSYLSFALVGMCFGLVSVEGNYIFFKSFNFIQLIILYSVFIYTQLPEKKKTDTNREKKIE